MRADSAPSEAERRQALRIRAPPTMAGGPTLSPMAAHAKRHAQSLRT